MACSLIYDDELNSLIIYNYRLTNRTILSLLGNSSFLSKKAEKVCKKKLKVLYSSFILRIQKKTVVKFN